LTLPGASSFVQVEANEAAVRQKALSALRNSGKGHPGLDFVVLAMQGKKIGFAKVIKMIDNLLATLRKEQLDDNHKKEYCEKQFDFAEDKKKELQHALSDLETQIEDAKEGLEQLTAEIAALEEGIKDLDKSVSEATEQRKEEHEEYTELMSSNGAAKELLNFAVNRLNKFYNPALHNPEQDGAELAQMQDEPEKLGAYKKKGEESNGVIAMINLLIKDLDKEMIEAKTAEKNAQADYEAMLSDSAEKRAGDTKALTEKTDAKASLEMDLQNYLDTKAATTKELMGTEKYISSLHAECDWLLQYFDARKAAREGETEALTNAKAILNGADFSLLEQGSQKKSRKFLRA